MSPHVSFIRFLGFILIAQASATLKLRKYVPSVQMSGVWPKMIYQTKDFKRMPSVRQSKFHTYSWLLEGICFSSLNVAVPVSEMMRTVHALFKGALFVTLVTPQKMRLFSLLRKMKLPQFIWHKVRFDQKQICWKVPYIRSNHLQTIWIQSLHHLSLSEWIQATGKNSFTSQHPLPSKEARMHLRSVPF